MAQLRANQINISTQHICYSPIVIHVNLIPATTQQNILAFWEKESTYKQEATKLFCFFPPCANLMRLQIN
jgi:hypothetical protein